MKSFHIYFLQFCWLFRLVFSCNKYNLDRNKHIRGALQCFYIVRKQFWVEDDANHLGLQWMFAHYWPPQTFRTNYPHTPAHTSPISGIIHQRALTVSHIYLIQYAFVGRAHCTANPHSSAQAFNSFALVSSPLSLSPSAYISDRARPDLLRPNRARVPSRRRQTYHFEPHPHIHILHSIVHVLGIAFFGLPNVNEITAR